MSTYDYTADLSDVAARFAERITRRDSPRDDLTPAPSTPTVDMPGTANGGREGILHITERTGEAVFRALSEEWEGVGGDEYVRAIALTTVALIAHRQGIPAGELLEDVRGRTRTPEETCAMQTQYGTRCGVRVTEHDIAGWNVCRVHRNRLKVLATLLGVDRDAKREAYEAGLRDGRIESSEAAEELLTSKWGA